MPTAIVLENGAIYLIEGGGAATLVISDGAAGPSNGELREDGSFELREDGTFELREG